MTKMQHYPTLLSTCFLVHFGYPIEARSSTGDYRFGFNGQEKDNEIYGEGKSYTAEFWQYDARLGRRWNVDPKLNPMISPYATFANNPIWFSDPFGDTLRTDGSEASSTDIRSIAGEHSDIVSISSDNVVSIDFDKVKDQDRFKNKNGTFNEKKFNKYQRQALRHAGVRLINNMSNDKLNYFYAATPVHTLETRWNDTEEWEEFSVDLSNYSGNYVDDYSWFNNVSTTPRGTETDLGSNSDLRTRPANGYDGVVFIAPGSIYTQKNGITIQVSRASYVFHELQENYFRTHYKMSYPEAHKSSIFTEDNWLKNLFDNPTPGEFYRFKYD